MLSFVEISRRVPSFSEKLKKSGGVRVIVGAVVSDFLLLCAGDAQGDNSPRDLVKVSQQVWF
jgi:hypothetical protein